jgi:multicomponent Na+:H+ antiporter subunit C
MLGGDGSALSDHASSGDGERAGATVTAGARKIPAEDAAAEEKPGSRNVTPGPEGGVE